MEPCPGCDRQVDRTHPIPPAVVNRTLLDSLGQVESPTDVDVCKDCLQDLMDGKTLPGGGGAIR